MHNKPVDLWTSPSGRLEPFETCGQSDGQRFALPTACPHSQASRPQLHRLNNNNFIISFILLGATLTCCIVEILSTKADN
jgi:hypothetical protein